MSKKEQLEELQVRIKNGDEYINQLREDLKKNEIWLSIQSTTKTLNELKEQEKELVDELHKERLEALYEIRKGYKVTSLYLSGDGEDKDMINDLSQVLVLKEAPSILELKCWFDGSGDYCYRIIWKGEEEGKGNPAWVLAWGWNEKGLWDWGYRQLKREYGTSSAPYNIFQGRIVSTEQRPLIYQENDKWK